MKKIFSLVLIAMLAVTVVSCDNNDDVQVDNDTFSTAYDLNNVSFAKDATGTYVISRNFNNALVQSDVILVYRKSGTTNSGDAVWQSIPRTLFLTQGELDYDFDFSRTDVLLKAGGDYDISTTPQFLNSQTFRIVVVPANTGKNANNNVDLTDYDSVIKYYNINESNIKSL